MDQRRNRRLPKKHLPSFVRRTAVLLAAGILAVGSNFAPLWYTMHHSKQTIRGGSELAAGEETSQEGLALDYATAWSYGRAESWNLLIPDFMGGDSGRAFTRDGKVAEALKPYGLEGIAEQLPAYWGSSPTLPDRPTWAPPPCSWLCWDSCWHRDATSGGSQPSVC